MGGGEPWGLIYLDSTNIGKNPSAEIGAYLGIKEQAWIFFVFSIPLMYFFRSSQLKKTGKKRQNELKERYRNNLRVTYVVVQSLKNAFSRHVRYMCRHDSLRNRLELLSELLRFPISQNMYVPTVTVRPAPQVVYNPWVNVINSQMIHLLQIRLFIVRGAYCGIWSS